jgi:glycerol 3-phosphatase-1
MPHHEDNNFSAAAEVVDFSALLFDMDGTIIESTPAIVKYWQETGREIGVDGDGKIRYHFHTISAFVLERELTKRRSHSANFPRPPQHRRPQNLVPGARELGM